MKTLCKCRGDIGGVHAKCNAKWACEKASTQHEKNPWIYCEICGSRYGPILLRKMTSAWIKDVRTRGAKSVEELVALFQKSRNLSEQGQNGKARKLCKYIIGKLLQEENPSDEHIAMRKLVRAEYLKQRGEIIRADTMILSVLGKMNSEKTEMMQDPVGNNEAENYEKKMKSFKKDTSEWIYYAGEYAQYLQKRKEYGKCVNLLEQICRQANLVMGPENRDTVIHTRNLGIAYMCAGEFAKCEEQMQLALEKKTTVYGQYHHQTTASMLDIVEMLRRQDRFEECAVWLEKVITARKQCFRADSVLETGAIFFCCMAYIASNNLEAAQEKVDRLEACGHGQFQRLGGNLRTDLADSKNIKLRDLSRKVCGKFMIPLEAKHYSTSGVRDLERYVLNF